MASTADTVHLVDNDFLIKLARWDLLGEFVAAFGTNPRYVRALVSLRGRAVSSDGHPNLRLCGTAGAAHRLKAFLSTASAPLPVDQAFLAVATGIGNLDFGEATLLGALCGGGGNYFYTGDKRAIKALAQLNGGQFDSKYRGKIICLEQALLFMIEQQGFGVIRDGLCSDLAADQGIANLLVGGAQTSRETFCKGLRSEIDQLQTECGGLLRLA